MNQSKLLVITEYFPPHIGGMEKVFHDLCKNLPDNFSAQVLTMWSNQESPRREEKQNYFIYRVNTKSRYVFTFLAIFAGWKHARSCDIIHTTTYNAAIPAWILAKIHRKPVVITIHEVINRKWFKIKWLRRWHQFAFFLVERLILTLPFDRYICVSNNTKADLLTIRPNANASTIYNALVTSPAPASRPLPDAPILYFGRPGYMKGLDYLSDHLNKLKDSKFQFLLVLAKDPASIRSKLVAKLKDNPNVTIVNSLPYPELLQQIRQARACIVPSINEGFGFSALQVCDSGTTLLASNQGSLPEVTYGNVIYFDPYSFDSFRTALEKLANNQVEHIEPHSYPVSTFIDKHIELYQNLQSPSTSKRLRIAVLADPVDQQRAGIHMYTKAVITELLKNQNKDTYELVIIHSRPNELFDNTDHYIIPWRPKLPGWRAYRQFWMIPRLLKKLKVDVVWEPAQFGPFNLPASIKRVTTVHDLTPILMPHTHLFFGAFIHRLFLKRVLKGTDLIIADSHHTAKDVREYLPGTEAKTTVIHLACEIDGTKSPEPEVLSRYGIKAPYFIYVGTLEPRKNIVTLIKAFTGFCEECPTSKHQLVLVGQKGWKFEDIFNEMMQSPYSDRIIVTGYVERQHLSSLYQLATAFVYPSFYEGFGLPVLEAMTCGSPCIVADRASLPEVGGDAVLYFNPDSVSELSTHLKAIFQDPELANKLSAKGQKRSHAFSWSKYAKVFIETITDSI